MPHAGKAGPPRPGPPPGAGRFLLGTDSGYQVPALAAAAPECRSGLDQSVDIDASESVACVVTRKRGAGFALIATVGILAIVLFAVAPAGLIGLGRPLVTTAHLQPVPTDVFESATGLHIEAPQTLDRACSLNGPRPLVRRLQGVAKAGCPLPVTEVVPSAARRRILGANLVRLGAPTSVLTPKQMAYRPVAWIVFFSGREAVGDYFTTIYDANTGVAVLNVVIVWWGPKGPPAPAANACWTYAGDHDR